MDLLERLREAQADTKRDMKRTDLRTKDVLLLSDIADVFGECADEIERLREELADYKLVMFSMNTELDLLRTQVRELRLQRDELVAALQVIVNTNPIYGASHDIAQATLAKVGEKL